MSTHNMFSWRNKKNIYTFGLKKKTILSRALDWYKGPLGINGLCV